MVVNLEIRQVISADKGLFAGAVELLNRTQGQDLFAPNYLDERVGSPADHVVGAFSGGVIVGVGVAQLIANYDYYLPFRPEIYDDLREKKVGSFSTLCVSEELQGRGVGQRISRMRLEWLRAQECEVVLGVSWVSGLAHTSNRVFEKMGFTAVKRVDAFYRQSSIEHPFVCPGCGDPPCECGAVLFRLDL